MKTLIEKFIILIGLGFLSAATQVAKAAPTYSPVGANVTITIQASGDIIDETYRNEKDIETITIINAGGHNYSISASAFENCTSLTTVTPLTGVIKIGLSAFQGCSKLASITIPSGVTKIGNTAFQECRSLESVIMKRSTPPTLGTDGFAGNHTNRWIYVPVLNVAAYKGATDWSSYQSRITAPARMDEEHFESITNVITSSSNNKMTNKYKVSLAGLADGESIKIIYEIFLDNPPTNLYKSYEETVSKSNTSGSPAYIFEKEYPGIRAAGDGTGTIRLTLKYSNGATTIITKDFTVTDVKRPISINIKKVGEE